MTRKQVLEDTIAFYSKNERAYDGLCHYYREGTHGCAVGRLVPKEVARLLEHENESLNTRNFKLLPEEVQELGLDFLKKLQTLHDTNVFWKDKQLTEEGEEFVENKLRPLV